MQRILPVLILLILSIGSVASAGSGTLAWDHDSYGEDFETYSVTDNGGEAYVETGTTDYSCNEFLNYIVTDNGGEPYFGTDSLYEVSSGVDGWIFYWRTFSFEAYVETGETNYTTTDDGSYLVIPYDMDAYAEWSSYTLIGPLHFQYPIDSLITDRSSNYVFVLTAYNDAGESDRSNYARKVFLFKNAAVGNVGSGSANIGIVESGGNAAFTIIVE